MNCYACDAVLEADNACPDTEYQFNNALWIGFFGGYGMFVDNLEAKLSTNSRDQWLYNKRDEPKISLTLGKLKIPFPARWYRYRFRRWLKIVDNPNFVPEYPEERMLNGADYEAVICHECAHKLCADNPWIEKLLNSHNSHSHKTSYHEAHPDHYGWDYDHEQMDL